MVVGYADHQNASCAQPAFGVKSVYGQIRVKTQMTRFRKNENNNKKEFLIKNAANFIKTIKNYYGNKKILDITPQPFKIETFHNRMDVHIYITDGFNDIEVFYGECSDWTGSWGEILDGFEWVEDALLDFFLKLEKLNGQIEQEKILKERQKKLDAEKIYKNKIEKSFDIYMRVKNKVSL